MVVEALMGLAVWLGELILGMMPANEVGSMVGEASAVVSGLAGMAAGISVWIPWSVAGIAVAATLASWVTLFVLKIVRQIVAHVPQFGGVG